MRMKTLYTKDAERTGISRFPNFHKTGSITGIYMTRIIGFIGRKTIFAPFSMEKRRERRKKRFV